MGFTRCAAGQHHGSKSRPWMAWKACAETADQILIAGPNLRPFAQNLAGFRVDQVQPTARRNVVQATGTQRGLHLPPVSRRNQRFSDDKPKAPEELLVDDVVTPRGTSLHALHRKPHQIAQHGTGGFITAVAGRKKALPKLRITGEGRMMCHAFRLPVQG
jgi:hypothetical protein